MKLLAALFLIALTLSAGAKTIKIGDEVFALQESKEGEQGSLEEYLPKGQTLATWRKMVAVRRFPKIASAKDYIGNMVADYQRRYPAMKFAAGSGPDEIYYMDCLMYPLGKEAKFVEWNYFVARPSAGGIVVYQYAERAPYEKEIKEGFEALNVKALRIRMLPILQKSIFVTGTDEATLRQRR